MTFILALLLYATAARMAEAFYVAQSLKTNKLRGYADADDLMSAHLFGWLWFITLPSTLIYLSQQRGRNAKH